jgi:hypothetical protein
MERAASSFTAIVVVSIASSKEARHNHILCLYIRPPYTICAPSNTNLTSCLAKFGLQVRGLGGVRGAARPQDRDSEGGEGSQANHGASRAGREGRGHLDKRRRRKGGGIVGRGGSSSSSSSSGGDRQKRSHSIVC